MIRLAILALALLLPLVALSQNLPHVDPARSAVPQHLRLREALDVSALERADTPGGLVPSEHRALFCRFDDKLDARRIPLRMRLGSLEEVNRMERKPGYLPHQH